MSGNRFRRWLRRHGILTGRLTRIVYYPEHSDLPDIPKANELAIAGTSENPKWGLLDCPCGRGHTILLPLSRFEDPHWTVSAGAHSRPSIHPSVDRNRYEGSRCHYWISNGKIRWV